MLDLNRNIFQMDHWIEPELSTESYLSNAVLMSLFSDERVDEIPKFECSHRGYWADSLNTKEEPLGSKLWTLYNKPLNQETLQTAIQYAYSSLSWLLLNQEIEDLSVDGELVNDSIQLFINVKGKERSYSYEFDVLRGTNAIL